MTELLQDVQGTKDSTKDTRRDKASIRVRCPQCFKLYQVNPDHIDTPHPQFACNSCDQVFWFGFPEILGYPESIGFPVNWVDEKSTEGVVQSELSHSEVNKNEVGLSFGGLELENPGFESPTEQVEETLRQINELSPTKPSYNFEQLSLDAKEQSALREEVLKNFTAQTPDPEDKSWSKLLDHFASKDAHNDFIKECIECDLIDYGVSKFEKLLSLTPHNDLAVSSLKQLKQELEEKASSKKKKPTISNELIFKNERFGARKPKKTKQHKNELHKKGQNSKRRARRPLFHSIAIFGLFFGALFIGVGLFVTPLQFLMGVGVGLVFLSLFLRVIFS